MSGIHGCGKSTFIQSLCDKDDSLVLHERKHSVTLEDTYLRAVWRLTKYFIEANEQECLSLENPGRAVLADRCVYDNFAYMDGFYRLGWVTESQMQHHRDVYEAMFTSQYQPKNVIFMCPPLDWVEERLSQRWQTEPKKWREEDTKYLSAVYEEFIRFYDDAPCLALRIEPTDIAQRVQLAKQWIYSHVL